MSSEDSRGSLRARAIGLLLFVPSMSVLGLSRWLTPDPSGVGTHQQLGLASCFVLEKFGGPCPMCGMTTTFSLMAHFSPLDALLNQPFGVLLFVLTIGVAVIGALEMARPGRYLRRATRWSLDRDRALAGLLLGAMAGAWLYKFALMKQMLPWAP